MTDEYGIGSCGPIAGILAFAGLTATGQDAQEHHTQSAAAVNSATQTTLEVEAVDARRLLRFLPLGLDSNVTTKIAGAMPQTRYLRKYLWE